MRHLKAGRKLNRTASHRKALMINLATSLFEHKRIHTTEAKAKELRMFAEKIITRAKNAISREKQGLLPDGQTVDVHNRREVARFIKNKEVLRELFDSIAPAVEDRPGGYTRIIKTAYRRGDSGSMALIELVDWSPEQEGPVSLKGKKKTKKSQPAPKQEAPKVETFDDSAEVVEGTEEVKEEAVETQATDEVETKTEEVSAEDKVEEKTEEAVEDETSDEEKNEESSEESKDDEEDKNKKSE